MTSDDDYATDLTSVSTSLIMALTFWSIRPAVVLRNTKDLGMMFSSRRFGGLVITKQAVFGGNKNPVSAAQLWPVLPQDPPASLEHLDLPLLS